MHKILWMVERKNGIRVGGFCCTASNLVFHRRKFFSVSFWHFETVRQAGLPDPFGPERIVNNSPELASVSGRPWGANRRGLRPLEPCFEACLWMQHFLLPLLAFLACLSLGQQTLRQQPEQAGGQQAGAHGEGWCFPAHGADASIEKGRGQAAAGQGQ